MIMLLAVDLRNKLVSIGLRNDKKAWVSTLNLAATDRSADEWRYLILSLLREEGIQKTDLSRAILSSVVPSYTLRFKEALGALLPPGKVPLLIGPGVRSGLRIRTDNPAEVGSDLVCTAVAALHLVGSPCLVVDFGTALSFTALDSKGDMIGAAFAPGLDSSAEYLREKSAQPPQVRLDQPQAAIGKNTTEAIRSGLLLGWAGLVDRLVEEISSELGAPGKKVYLVGTGASKSCPIKTTRSFDLWEPALALEGMALIDEMNQ
ncbi:type III pantothenate kinase [Treponema sp.]